MRPFIAAIIGAAGLLLLVTGAKGNAKALFGALETKTGPVTGSSSSTSSTAAGHAAHAVQAAGSTTAHGGTNTLTGAGVV